jgi:hypothetical protein
LKKNLVTGSKMIRQRAAGSGQEVEQITQVRAEQQILPSKEQSTPVHQSEQMQ